VGEVERNIPKINVALEDHQAEYQPNMIEFDGKIWDQNLSIFIDPRVILSYIIPKLVEQFCLQVVKFKSPWLV